MQASSRSLNALGVIQLGKHLVRDLCVARLIGSHQPNAVSAEDRHQPVKKKECSEDKRVRASSEVVSTGKRGGATVSRSCSALRLKEIPTFDAISGVRICRTREPWKPTGQGYQIGTELDEHRLAAHTTS